MNEVYICRCDDDVLRIPRSLEVCGGGSVDITFVVLPGVNADIRMDVSVNGPAASVSIHGLYVSLAEEKVRMEINLVHNSGGSTSRQLIKGVASGKSDVRFHGKITVAQDAQKTEAYQENHNLLLSDDARVETLPQLEIYADDVKCSHGATVGRLSEEEQFYMCSRGITPLEARRLQIISFLHPVIASIADESVREDVRTLVEQAIK